jgi:hypothetical protein
VRSRAQAVAFAFRHEHDVDAHALRLDHAREVVAEPATPVAAARTMQRAEQPLLTPGRGAAGAAPRSFARA